MGIFDRIHSSPVHIRGRYAFFTAFFITGIIGAVWATTLPARFASFNRGKDMIIENESTHNLKEIFTDRKKQITDSTEILQGSFENLTANVATTEHLDSLTNNLPVGVGTSTYASSTQSRDGMDIHEYNEPSSPEMSESTSTHTFTTTIPPTKTPKIILIGTSTSPKAE